MVATAPTRPGEPSALAELGASGRLGIRMLLGLLAGRATFRLVLYGANVTLLAGWGHHTYARYAAASGALVWVVALAQAGPEKTALKLIPRPGQAREATVAGLLAIVRGVPLVFCALAALAIAVDQHAVATLYVASAAQSVAIGLNVAGVALQRALGRAGRDISNFALLSAAWAVLTAFAVVLHLPPVLYLFSQCVAAIAVTEVTLRGLRAPTRSLAGRPRARRRLDETVALMGVYDVAALAATSAVFLVLPLTRNADQSGDLYLALAGWGVALGFLVYALRVFQPRMSLWLAGEGSLTGRGWARSLAAWALALNAAWLVVVAVVLVAGGFRALAPGIVTVAALTGLLLSRSPVSGLMLVSVCLLENADVGSLRAVAAGAAGGLVLVLVASAAVIPFFGAAGAIWALATDELVQAGVVLRRLR
ncbi:MAG: hypothetical protein ABR521_08930 [Gaiellaceae bacterium]